MMRLSKCLVLLAASAATASPARPVDPPSALAAVKSCIAARAARDEYSGTILIAEKGKIIWQSGFGFADADRQVPITPSTRFNIASTGKMFTAVAIGQLAEAGRLSFDDPIGLHLPDLPPELRPITIDQLLTHRSGLRDYFQPRNRAVVQNARTATDLLPIAIADGLAFAPGSSQAYSNSGYVVLGAIVERLSGSSFADYLQRHVFARAGMAGTSLDGIAPRATPMTRMSPDGSRTAGPRRPAAAIGSPRGTPAGGATSTIGDMFRFAEALRRHLLTRPRTTETLWQAHVPSGERRPGERSSYGYGFNRLDVDGTRLVGHGGGSIGVNAQIEIWPEAQRIVVALSNYDPPAATEAMRSARRAFLGGDGAAVCAEY